MKGAVGLSEEYQTEEERGTSALQERSKLSSAAIRRNRMPNVAEF